MIISNFLTRALAKRLKRWTETYISTHEPSQIIGGIQDPYLFRWRLRQSRQLCNVYLHLITRDDDDRAPHDHPWPSVSIVLDGPLSEVRRLRDGRDVIRHFKAGDIVIRSPWAKHRLFLGPFPALTFFMIGPRVREWGFYCPKGWVHWKDFTTGPKGERVGRGCE